MATYSYYPEHGKCLTAMHDQKEGDIVTLSVGSNAYSLPMGRSGWKSTQWTKYVLPAPVGINKFGAALFDLAEIGQCPIDGSFQNQVTADAARERELQCFLARAD
jgi:hypothetical protein